MDERTETKEGGDSSPSSVGRSASSEETAGARSSSSSAAKANPLSDGVQVAPEDPSAGVEVFPGVSATDYNERQRQRRARNADTY